MNARQEMFAREYLTDFCATQAAIRAGYSERTAGSQGERLLRNVEVKELIDTLMAERVTKIDVTQERVIQELARIAFGDLRSVVEWDGKTVTLKSSKVLTDDDAATLAEVAENERGVRIKRFDKLKALELIGKHLGMFRERFEVSGPDGGKIPLDLSGKTDEELLALLEKLEGKGVTNDK